jgi:hypothetical protein
MAAKKLTLSDKCEASRRLPGRASLRAATLFCAYMFALLSAAERLEAITVSHDDAVRIGRKVWQNECGGTVAGLTSWNEGENFASLGIGHFIWYPRGIRGPFDESFPKLVEFVRARGSRALPKFIGSGADVRCPWSSRREFVAAQQTADMSELREFLAATVDLQAEFLVSRLQESLPKMLEEARPGDPQNVQKQFERVGSTGQGCYALIDYVNFKGEGVLHSERYAGQGWGLLQVLQGMHGSGNGKAAVEEFAASAKTVLSRRVQNSPPERKESRWLGGWLNRISTYRDF